jgi:hypothetical protein
MENSGLGETVTVSAIKICKAYVKADNQIKHNDTIGFSKDAHILKKAVAWCSGNKNSTKRRSGRDRRMWTSKQLDPLNSLTSLTGHQTSGSRLAV